MLNELQKNIVEEMKLGVGVMIDNNAERLFRDMGKAIEEDESGGDFKFKLAVGLEIVPMGEEAYITPEIGWSLRRKSKGLQRTASATPGLPGLLDEEAGADE